MYSIVIILHNLIRWVVLAAAIYALIRMYRGWLGKRSWQDSDRKAGFYFSLAYDIQVLLGVILTIVSPLVTVILNAPQQAMQVDDLRMVVEHIPLMVIGLIAIHLTSVISKRAESDLGKFRRAAIGYSLAFLVTLLAIPWGRALIPGLG